MFTHSLFTMRRGLVAAVLLAAAWVSTGGEVNAWPDEVKELKVGEAVDVDIPSRFLARNIAGTGAVMVIARPPLLKKLRVVGRLRGSAAVIIYELPPAGQPGQPVLFANHQFMVK